MHELVVLGYISDTSPKKKHSIDNRKGVYGFSFLILLHGRLRPTDKKQEV